MNKLKVLIIIFVTQLLLSCGFSPHKIMSNESSISSESRHIFINDKKLGYYEGIRVPAGLQTVSFNGLLTLSGKKQRTNSENKEFSGTCLVLLPFCLIGKFSDSVSKHDLVTVYIESTCSANTKFLSKKGTEYIISVKTYIDTLPELIVKENTRGWKTIKTEKLICSPNQSFQPTANAAG